MPTVFDKLYAGHHEHNWWDFFCTGIVEGRRAWRSSDHGSGESPVPGDEVTLTSLYEDLGVATGVPSATLSTADLIRRADEALYAGKREGRDRVTAGDEAVSS
jgi:GGDEF domain-containing protein